MSHLRVWSIKWQKEKEKNSPSFICHKQPDSAEFEVTFQGSMNRWLSLEQTQCYVSNNHQLIQKLLAQIDHYQFIESKKVFSLLYLQTLFISHYFFFVYSLIACFNSGSSREMYLVYKLFTEDIFLVGLTSRREHCPEIIAHQFKSLMELRPQQVICVRRHSSFPLTPCSQQEPLLISSFVFMPNYIISTLMWITHLGDV